MPLPVGFSNLSCYSRELIKQSVKEGIENHKRLSEFKDKYKYTNTIRDAIYFCMKDYGIRYNVLDDKEFNYIFDIIKETYLEYYSLDEFRTSFGKKN